MQSTPSSLQPHAALLLPLLLAVGSPWWEQYETQEKFLCRDNNLIVLERNDAQAALISGRSRTTLFREVSAAPAVLYRNEQLSISLKGDELVLEQAPRRIVCLRTDQA